MRAVIQHSSVAGRKGSHGRVSAPLLSPPPVDPSITSALRSQQQQQLPQHDLSRRPYVSNVNPNDVNEEVDIVYILVGGPVQRGGDSSHESRKMPRGEQSVFSDQRSRSKTSELPSPSISFSTFLPRSLLACINNILMNVYPIH